MDRFCSEIVEDIFEHVKTPTPPLPDYNVEANREREFEVQNKRLGIWYSDTSYRMFLQLQEDVLRAAKLDDSFRWHFSAEKIKENIQKIEDALDRQLMLTRWEECVHISKKKPANKSSYYNQFRALLANLSQKVPEIAEKNFEAQGLSKKKFKDKDEEAKFLATCKDKLEEDLGLKLLEEVKVEEEESFKIKILDDEKFRYKHDQEYISKLGRLKGPKDCEVEGKRVMAKFSLRVKMDKCRFQ